MILKMHDLKQKTFTNQHTNIFYKKYSSQGLQKHQILIFDQFPPWYFNALSQNSPMRLVPDFLGAGHIFETDDDEICDLISVLKFIFKKTHWSRCKNICCQVRWMITCSWDFNKIKSWRPNLIKNKKSEIKLWRLLNEHTQLFALNRFHFPYKMFKFSALEKTARQGGWLRRKPCCSMPIINKQSTKLQVPRTPNVQQDSHSKPNLLFLINSIFSARESGQTAWIRQGGKWAE